MRPNRRQRRANARMGKPSRDPAEALNSRGMMLTDTSRHEEALANFNAALSLNPDFVEGA